MRFTFKAKDENGVLKRGTIDANDQESAITLLQKNNLIPISVENADGNKSLSQKVEELTSKVKMKDILLFYREFSTLVNAKVPVSNALQTIYEQAENPVLRPVIKELIADIEDGASISDAFSKHPKIFSELSVNMIRSGEVSGNLQGAIDYVTTTTEQNYLLISKVRGALLYPAFVIGVAFIVGLIMTIVILPKLSDVIRDLGVETPWYTDMMMAFGDFMKSYWWIVIGALVFLVGGLVYYLRTDEGKKEWDRIQLKIPVIGDLMKYVYLTRFSENLSVLIAGGIPIVKALEIIADVVNNSVYKKIILDSAEDVKVGGDIHSGFFGKEEIPPMVARMLKVGEETGRMSEILDDLARFYRGEVDQITRNLSTLIEPILIVVLGVGVGFLVVSVLLPIYNIAGQI